MFIDQSQFNYIFKISADYVVEPDCGVITASDSNYSSFIGLQCLTALLHERVPMTVFDLGLTTEEVSWLRHRDVTVKKISLDISLPFWQSWNKPRYFSESPYQNTLWLDTDCFPVGNLSLVFKRIQDSILLTKHWKTPQEYSYPNSEELYKRYPPNHRFSDVVNAGVIGFNSERDTSFVETFLNITDSCSLYPEIQKYVGWHDEGCLHWTMQHLNLKENICQNTKWNEFVAMYLLNKDKPPGTSQKLPSTMRTFLQTIPITDDSMILHYSNVPKPWELFGNVAGVS